MRRPGSLGQAVNPSNRILNLQLVTVSSKLLSGCVDRDLIFSPSSALAVVDLSLAQSCSFQVSSSRQFLCSFRFVLRSAPHTSNLSAASCGEPLPPVGRTRILPLPALLAPLDENTPSSPFLATPCPRGYLLARRDKVFFLVLLHILFGFPRPRFGWFSYDPTGFTPLSLAILSLPLPLGLPVHSESLCSFSLRAFQRNSLFWWCASKFFMVHISSFLRNHCPCLSSRCSPLGLGFVTTCLSPLFFCSSLLPCILPI